MKFFNEDDFDTYRYEFKENIGFRKVAAELANAKLEREGKVVFIVNNTAGGGCPSGVGKTVLLLDSEESLMTRKKEIEKAAYELEKGCEGEQDVFIRGAEWADSNPIYKDHIDILRMGESYRDLEQKLAITEQKLLVAVEALETLIKKYAWNEPAHYIAKEALEKIKGEK